MHRGTQLLRTVPRMAQEHKVCKYLHYLQQQQ